MRWVKEAAINRSSVMQWLGGGRREAFCGPVLSRPQSFVDIVLLSCELSICLSISLLCPGGAGWLE